MIGVAGPRRLNFSPDAHKLSNLFYVFRLQHTEVKYLLNLFMMLWKQMTNKWSLDTDRRCGRSSPWRTYVGRAIIYTRTDLSENHGWRLPCNRVIWTVSDNNVNLIACIQLWKNRCRMRWSDQIRTTLDTNMHETIYATENRLGRSGGRNIIKHKVIRVVGHDLQY